MTVEQFKQIEDSIVGAIVKTCQDTDKDSAYAVSSLIDSLNRLYNLKEDHKLNLSENSDCEIVFITEDD
jgi:hypothetical protein